MKSITVDNISKKYGALDALTNVSFRVDESEIFGLIGADGAGKTTLIRILATLLIADSGTATMQGVDTVAHYRTIRQMVGYMPGRFSLYQDLTVEENLNFFATLFGTTIRENYELIEPIYTQIEPFRNRRAGKLSGGMKQKLALCCALIHRPKVLLLDEPTTGVDAVSRKEFWQMLRRLKEHNITILVSTPYMDEAMQCDHIGLISGGQMLTVDTPGGIISNFGEPIWRCSATDMPRLLRDLRAMSVVKSCFAFGAEHHITFNSTITIESLEQHLTQMGHRDITIRTANPTIEDCFMKLAK